MSNNGHNLKEEVRAFWQANPCGTKFTDAEMGSREFYERVAEHRYGTEWHIPAAADFESARGLKVLEIGCGWRRRDSIVLVSRIYTRLLYDRIIFFSKSPNGFFKAIP